MEEISPRPYLVSLAFHDCWCQVFLERIHKIPVKLEEVQCVLHSGLFLANAFGFPHESAKPSSENPVEVLNICCFDFVSRWIPIDNSTDFVDETAVFSDLYELSVIDAVLSEKLGQNKCVVIIPIRKYL